MHECAAIVNLAGAFDRGLFMFSLALELERGPSNANDAMEDELMCAVHAHCRCRQMTLWNPRYRSKQVFLGRSGFEGLLDQIALKSTLTLVMLQRLGFTVSNQRFLKGFCHGLFFGQLQTLFHSWSLVFNQCDRQAPTNLPMTSDEPPTTSNDLRRTSDHSKDLTCDHFRTRSDRITFSEEFLRYLGVWRVVSKRVVLADVPWPPKTGTRVQKTERRYQNPERGYKKWNDCSKTGTSLNEGTFTKTTPLQNCSFVSSRHLTCYCHVVLRMALYLGQKWFLLSWTTTHIETHQLDYRSIPRYHV